MLAAEADALGMGRAAGFSAGIFVELGRGGDHAEAQQKHHEHADHRASAAPVGVHLIDS